MLATIRGRLIEKMDKKEMEEIIGHSIRLDTYYFINRMMNGEDYSDIYKDLDSNREKYNIKKEILLIKESTCQEYLQKIKDSGEYEIDIDIEIKGKRTRIKKEDWHDKTGIYGIYLDNILIYIGKTTISFRQRFQQHINRYKTDDSYLHSLMHKAKENGKNIEFKPLIIIEDLQIANGVKINERDLNSMELALITIYQPVGNVEGRLKPYKYRNN